MLSGRPSEKLTVMRGEEMGITCEKATFSNKSHFILPICGDFQNIVPKLPVASGEKGLRACLPVRIRNGISELGPCGTEIDQ